VLNPYRDLAFFPPPKSVKRGWYASCVKLDKAAPKEVSAPPSFLTYIQGSFPLCKASKAHAMTHTAESGSTAPRPPDPWCLLRPMGLCFARPDPWANRRGALLWWRGLRRRAGWPLGT
jgi:hypothetical protein